MIYFIEFFNFKPFLVICGAQNSSFDRHGHSGLGHQRTCAFGRRQRHRVLRRKNQQVRRLSRHRRAANDRSRRSPPIRRLRGGSGVRAGREEGILQEVSLRALSRGIKVGFLFLFTILFAIISMSMFDLA